MNIEYKVKAEISVDEFVELIERSTLAERRPVENRECMAGMIANADLITSAWIGKELVGIARSLTDFHYACYMSDLAVSKEYQGQGIGRQLQVLTQDQLGPECKLILLAAPDANSYYEHLGFTNNPRCWVLDATSALKAG